MSKGSVYLNIPRIGKVIMIWDEVLFKLRVSVYGMVTRKKVLLEYSKIIEKYLDVVVEILKVQSSVSFYFRLDEEFIESW